MARQRLLACALALCALLTSNITNATSEWLMGQQRADGAFAATGDIAATFQATAEALQALKAVQPAWDATAARAYLDSETRTYIGTEFLCRKITSAAVSGGDHVSLAQQLLSRKNDDGGYGEDLGFASSNHDTAFAAEALAAAGLSNSQEAGFAVGYLLRQQNANGWWPGPDGSESIYTTALSLRALWAYRHRFDVSGAIARARNYLLSQRVGGSLWTEPHLSALSLAAVVPTLDNRSDLQLSLAALAELQDADGSYGADVYTTALALQALSTAQKPFADRISISGRVVDGDSGAPIVAAEVRVTGPASSILTTADDGTFSFQSPLAGAYDLAISSVNYGSVTASTTLRAGQSTNFGDIALLRGDVPTTAVLRGRVTDNISSAPLANVRIEIAGLGLFANTNSNGEYQIGAVPAGAATIVASKEGYATLQATTTFVAGRIFAFSPQMSVVASTFVTLAGTVTDAQTGGPLAGVTITATTSAGSVTTLTDDTGAYSLASLAPGSLTAAATLDGYHSITGTATAAAGTKVTFSPALTAVSLPPPPPPATGAVAGGIADSTSGTPISSATVQFVVGSTVRGTATTDIEGRFLISNVVGSGELRISRSNYRALTLPVNIAANTGVDVGMLELVPNSLGNGGSFRGLVRDALTNAPRSGVTVTAVFGGTTRTATTNSAGEFSLTGINPLSGTVTLARSGYESLQLGLELSLGEIINVGDVYLRPVNTDEVRGDLIVQSVDPKQLQVDANTFVISGSLPTAVMNSGNAALLGSVRVVAFSDGNLNGRFDAPGEVPLGQANLDIDLAPGASASTTVALNGTLPFRDAPVSVFVDADNSLIEQSEANNVDSTAGVCRNSQRLAVDLGLCMDSSGSISAADFQLQLQGTAAAIENPAIIPHDGSVRLTVMQFDSATRVELAPTILDSSNAATLAARIRGIRKSGGGTAIHSCINTATQQLSNALPKAAIRVIDLATDGGSSQSLAEQAARNAQAAGIDALNALAVGGGADLNVLNAIVFPKTTGPDAGFVVEIDTFEQYAQAIADKIRREARTADLTLGRLQIKDEGSFVTLSARAGNGGSRTVPAGVTVSFHAGDPAAGGVLLGTVTLPQLVTGEFTDITLSNVTALRGGETVFAVADAAGTVGECNVVNNQISSSAGLLRGSIQTATDATVYAPNSPVQLRANIANLGSLAGTFRYRLQVEDAQGAAVVTFAAEDTGTINAGANVSRVQPWNTGNFLAGAYRLHGLLTLSDGTPVGESVTPFMIAHDTSSGPAASIRVNTDRSVYNTTDRVTIETLVRNLTTSTLMPNTSAQVTVRAPQGAIILQQTLPIGDLNGGNVRETQLLLALSAAVEGEYVVTAELLDAQNSIVAVATDTFLVQEDAAMTLTGTVEIAAERLVSGEPQTCTSTVRNRGTLNLGAQPMRVSVVRLADETEILNNDFTAALPAGASHIDVRSEATTGFVTGDYACVLQAQVNGAWRPLDFKAFHVEQPPIRLEASMTTGARGRLLVLMDEKGQWPCTRLKNIELWAPFRMPLPRDAKIDVELLDANDRRVDFESIRLRDYRGSINRSRGTGVDLTITGVSADVLTVQLNSAQGLGEGYHIVATATADSVPPIKLETDVMGESCGWHAGVGARFGDFHCSGGRSHHGGHLPPPLGTEPSQSSQRAFLERLLDASRWSYKIVTDDEAFERELRTGAYSQYALLSEHEKLSEQTQKELREAVYRGEGLLDAGRHDHRHHGFDQALGITPFGRHALATSVQFNAAWMPAQTAGLFLRHDALRVRLAGAQPIAKFPGVYGYDTAVTAHEYGRGKSVYAGYDVLAEATKAGENSLHAQLLKNALEHVQPSFNRLLSSQVMPLTITVQNRGIATPGRVLLPLPQGVTVVDPGEAQLVDGALSWSFQLSVDAQRSFEALVRLPDASGAVLFDALIQSGSGSTFVDQTHATLGVTTIAPASIEDAIASAGHSLHFIKVRFWLEKARFWLARGQRGFALASLVQATDEVMCVSHPQADEVRLQIDEAIWRLGQELE